MLLKKLKLNLAGSDLRIKRQIQRKRRKRVWSVGTHWNSCRNSGNSLQVCTDKEGMDKMPVVQKGGWEHS